MTPTCPVKDVLSWVISSEPCRLVAERVLIVVLELVVTWLPFFSHKTEGCGKPRMTQNKVAEVFRALLTDMEEVWTLGGTARKFI